MKLRRFPAVLLAAALCVATTLADAGLADASDALWAKLQEGGHVALIRHAAAPGVVGDPKGFELDDCTTQRNLSDEGRAEARRLGDAFRAHEVPVGKVLSSQWCRCRDTATLMDIGRVEMAPTFNNAFVLRDRRAALTAGAREVISAWRGPGTLVVLTHGANILALTGTRPAEGAIMVVEPDPSAEGGLRRLGQIAPLS